MNRPVAPFLVESLMRPAVLRLEPYQSARDSVLEGILLDANENPFEKRLQGVALNRYPDPNQKELRRALSEAVGLPPSNLLAAAGSDEVLDWIFKVFVEQGSDQVAIAEPTYGMYRVMANIYGARIFEFELDRQFDFDSTLFLQRVPTEVKVLFLCSPNNPTGNLLNRDQVLSLLRMWNRIVVVDEAYLEFAGVESICGWVLEFPNLIVLRTFSKALGRAGLRLGYVAADERLIAAFLKVKSPYNLGAFTLEQGIQALRKSEEQRGEIDCIVSERERLRAALEEVPGVEMVFPSRANFLLFRCREASAVYRNLLSRGIVVRDRGSMKGLRNCLRVTLGTPRENRLFLKELVKITAERAV